MPVYIEGSKNPEMFEHLLQEFLVEMQRSPDPEPYKVVQKHGHCFEPPAVAEGNKTDGFYIQDSAPLAQAAAKKEGWIYVEGAAFSKGFPMPWLHAWCIDHAGMVRELSWLHPGDYYFGVPIRNSTLWQMSARPLIWHGHFTVDNIGRHLHVMP